MAHDEPLTDIALSPDGRWVVSGSWGGGARGDGDVANGQEMGAHTHEMPVVAPPGVNGCGFEPRWTLDGHRENHCDDAAPECGMLKMGVSCLAWCMATDPQVTQQWPWTRTGAWWSLETRETSLGLRGCGDRVGSGAHGARDAAGVGSVALGPDGRWVLSGSEDGRVPGCWELSPRASRRQHGKHGGPVTDATFSPDGRWVLSGSEVWHGSSVAVAARGFAGRVPATGLCR